MSLEDLGNIGEFVGAIAVVLSLIYLAFQIRQNTFQLNQNTEVVRANAELDNARLAADFNARIANNGELSELWRLGNSAPIAISQEQTVRFGFLMGDLFYRLEGLFRQYRRGFLGSESWEAWASLMSRMLTTPVVRGWWDTGQHPFSVSFREYVDQLIQSGDGSPSQEALSERQLLP
jgi:hypothetical protein